MAHKHIPGRFALTAVAVTCLLTLSFAPVTFAVEPSSAFELRRVHHLEDWANAVELGDVDGDGRVDIVTAAGLQRGRVSVFRGLGDGRLRRLSEYRTAGFTEGLALVDLNHDGALDLVTAAFSFEHSDEIAVRLGNGDGTFDGRHWISIQFEPLGIAAADLNEDGDQDLAITSVGYCECGILSILLGNGDGTFAEPIHHSVGKGSFDGSVPYEVATLDLNEDAHLDLAIANFGDVRSGGLALLMGNGDGSFQAPQHYRSRDSFELSHADLNSDGHQDLVVNHDFSQSLSVFLGNGDGTIQEPGRYDSAGGTAGMIAIADYDADDVLDLAVPNTSCNVSVLPGQGDGTFAPPVVYPGRDGALGLATEDLDGDLDSDLAVTNYFPGGLSIYINDPTAQDAPFLCRPTRILQRSRTIKLAWGRATSISSFDLRHRKARFDDGFGRYKRLASGTMAWRRAFLSRPGFTNCFSVRGDFDGGGTSDWSEETCASVPVDDLQLTQSGEWKQGTGVHAYEDTLSSSSDKGAALKLRGVRTKRLALLVRRCFRCGSVKVSLGGRFLGRFSVGNYGPQLVEVTDFRRVRRGTLRIEVARNKTVIIDGIVTSRV